MRISNQSQNSNTFAIAIRVIKVSVIVSLLSPSASLLAPLPLFFLPISATLRDRYLINLRVPLLLRTDDIRV